MMEIQKKITEKKSLLHRLKTMLVFAGLLISSQVAGGNLEKELPAVWNAVKIETTNAAINTMIQSQFKETVVEFTKAGTVKVSGNDTQIKYRAGKKTITFSQGLASAINKPVVNAEINKSDLTVNVPAELTKQLILTAKDMYLKSGGEAFVGKMLENLALNNKIEAVITLKRK